MERNCADNLPVGGWGRSEAYDCQIFTPNGNYIHGVGIGPDIELEYEYLDKDATSYDEAYDNQIQKAIEVLKDKIQ